MTAKNKRNVACWSNANVRNGRQKMSGKREKEGAHLDGHTMWGGRGSGGEGDHMCPLMDTKRWVGRRRGAVSKTATNSLATNSLAKTPGVTLTSSCVK